MNPDYAKEIEPVLLALAKQLSNNTDGKVLRIKLPEDFKVTQTRDLTTNPQPLKLTAGIEYDPELNRTLVVVAIGGDFNFRGTPEQAHTTATIALKFAQYLDKMADVAKPNG